MRVTIVPVDRLIIHDSVIANVDSWPFEDAHIHAIQFLDGKGEIELKGPPPVNEPFEDLEIIQPYLDHLASWLAEKAAAAGALEEGAPEQSSYTDAVEIAP